MRSETEAKRSYPENVKRDRLAQDGILEASNMEFQTYPARPHMTGKPSNPSWVITIPRQIRHLLKIHDETILQVAVKTVSEEQCREIFLYVPKRNKRNREPSFKRKADTKKYFPKSPSRTSSPRITCPVCGTEGAVYVFSVKRKYKSKKTGQIKIYKSIGVKCVHRDEVARLVTDHNISKYRFPEVFATFATKHVR